MLPAPTFDVADRLITTLTDLVQALANLLTPRTTPDSPEYAAHTLLRRLVALIATIIRLDTDGPRTPPDHRSTPPSEPIERPRPDRTPTPRRSPGWLLAALPDLAPTIAADLAAILADPAFTNLLAAAPTLHRSLRPFLRGLGLPRLQTPSPPPPDAPLPAAPLPKTPGHPIPRTASPLSKPPIPRQPAKPRLHHSHSAPPHVQFIT